MYSQNLKYQVNLLLDNKKKLAFKEYLSKALIYHEHNNSHNRLLLLGNKLRGLF